MSFGGGGGGGGGAISGATDVVVSNIAGSEYLQWNTSTLKWNNTGLAGKAALANQGGAETLNARGNTTGTLTIDLALGNVVSARLTGNVTTVNISGQVSGKACSFGLYLTQDGTGSRTVTWPTSVKWAGGVAPTLSTGANDVDILVFETIDNGTNWYGSLVGANFS